MSKAHIAVVLLTFFPSAMLLIVAILTGVNRWKPSTHQLNPFQIPAAPRKARGARPAVTSPPSGRAAGFLKGVKP